MTEPFTWYDMDFWSSGEWQVLEEKIDEMDQKKILYCPGYDRLFSSLDLVSFKETRVMFIGQDPYPDPRYATGVAFSIPEGLSTIPGTLRNILSEYTADCGMPYPKSGNLETWCKQGVLLWNSIPTCYAYQPGSHRDWTEWSYLTKEMVERLSEKGTVIVSLGTIAKSYVNDNKNSRYLHYTHPSPRNNTRKVTGGTKFLGSRVFTTVNAMLKEINLEPVVWRLE